MTLIPEIQKIDLTPLPTGNSFVNRITDFKLKFYQSGFLVLKDTKIRWKRRE
jgi:hypothetical protein